MMRYPRKYDKRKMWGRKSKETASEGDVKEELLRRLSHAVQEVQLNHSRTAATCATDEGTSSLITVLEAIFLHALKRTLLESARKTIALTDDARPTPSFFEAVRSVTHKDTMAIILKLKRVQTEVGRSRAWLRLGLNEAAIPSYLVSLSRDRIIGRYYRPMALLRDREALDTAARILEGLLPVPFEIPLNSSLLNTWSTEPLLLSGLWSPALRNTPTTAVDVVGTIEDDEVCSVVASTPSVRSLMTLDENQAIRIILDTPLFKEEPELLPEDVAKEVDKAMDDLEVERRNIMQRSFSTLVESYSPQTESMLAMLVKKDAEAKQKRLEMQAAEAEEHHRPSDELSSTEAEESSSRSHAMDGEGQDVKNDTSKKTEDPRLIEEDYETLLAMVSSPRLADFEAGEKLEEKTSKEEERTIEQIIFEIPRESGLTKQKMECADCRLTIGFDFGAAVLCSVTGKYLCENCHKGALSVVPARIIYNWDHSKYPTGEKAARYLASMLNQPLFHIDKINPKLYSAVPDLQQILHMRKQLNFLHLYNKTCKKGTKLSVREYFFKSVHLYSLADLIGVANGNLKAELSKTISAGKSHVLHCWICKEKGFICEVCRDPQVIYPFDDGSIYRCHKCQAVYHGTCLSKDRGCPKCKRRRERMIDRQRQNTQ